MASAVRGSENEITTALAVARPHFFEHLLVGGISVHHRLADLPRGAHPYRIEIDGDVFEALRLQHARHVLAHAAEAAQDDVLALGDRQGDGILAFDGGLRRTAFTQQPARHALVVGQEDSGARTMASTTATSMGLRDGGIDGAVLQQAA